MLLSRPNGNTRALPVPDPDENAQFEFVVEPRARPDLGTARALRKTLADRPPHLLSGDPDARHTPVVRDGHPLEVRRQRAVRAQQLDDVARVIDRRIEIRVVADPRRQAVFHIGLRHEAPLECLSHGSGVPAAMLRAEQFEQRMPQRPPRIGAHREEVVQRWLHARTGSLSRKP